ncbi:hypothetical protein [Natrinema gelatinilyticum]|uniref:hypothetical protein n=1 Tax=Natrinema gelatinilyticum TaxID=2961571 RepID=UPI0020C55DD2|nr:hypothetical protein [Natrinema gelatinilyticum]
MNTNSNGGDQNVDKAGNVDDEDATEVIAAVPPTGWWAVLRKLASDEGYYKQAAEELGTKAVFTFKNTWDDVPTWTSGKADIAQFGALEASRIGPRREIPITVFGKFVPLNFGPMVKTGGKYDPKKTGGVKQSIDKIVNDNAKFGIGSWGGADATAYDVAMAENFNYRFKEDGGDFSVVTAGYFTMGKQVADGKLAVGSSGEGMGAAPQMMNGDIKPLFWLKDLVSKAVFGQENKWGFPTMQNLVTRTEFYENNKKAIQVYYQAQEKALQKLRKDPLSVITRSKDYVETMGAGSEEEAKFIVNYGINLEGTDSLPAPKHPAIYDTTAMSDQYVQTQSDFLNKVAQKGLTEKNWGDYVQHVQF